MQTRRLGRTNLMVSCLGLGALGFLDISTREIDQPYRILNLALKEGMNFIDTARTYYDSEKIIGKALGDRRNKCILATKTLMRGYRTALKDIELSLKNMRTDRIDLYQLHHIQYEYELEKVLAKDGALKALKEAQAAGKIDYIGVSSHSYDMMVKCIKTGEFDTIQIPLNPIEKEHAHDVINLAKQMDMGIIVMKPLAGGNITNVELALKFALAHDVSTVLVGATRANHVKTDAGVGNNFVPLSEEERKFLFKEIENLDAQFCRRCKYCQAGCPVHLPIADIFRCQDYLRLNATYARDEYRRLNLKGKKCIRCGQCEKICPYHLPVSEMLKRASRRLSKGRIEGFIIGLLRKIGLYDTVRTIYFNLKLPLPKR